MLCIALQIKNTVGKIYQRMVVKKWQQGGGGLDAEETVRDEKTSQDQEEEKEEVSEQIGKSPTVSICY